MDVPITVGEGGAGVAPVPVPREGWQSDREPLTIRRCARCGGRHDRLKFLPFAFDRIGRWTHWALCPGNGEPLLMHFHFEGCECRERVAR